MNNSKKRLSGAKEKFGSVIEIDKKLNAYSGKILAPAKLKKINKLIATLHLK